MKNLLVFAFIFLIQVVNQQFTQEKCVVYTQISRNIDTYTVYLNECGVQLSSNESLITDAMRAIGINKGQIKFIAISYTKYLKAFTKGNGMYMKYKYGAIVPKYSWAG